MASNRPLNDLYVQPIGDMVQGVSQQSARQRRDSQADSQFDCLNSPADGVIPRPHFEFVFRAASADYTHDYFYELARGLNEHYLGVISGGDIVVYDLADGTVCTVSPKTDTAYLTPVSGDPRDTFDAQCVDDYSFILNKTFTPAMTGAVVASRPKEALVFFKAGGYSVTYNISITYDNGSGSKVYTWTYKTPDNSVAGNAAYITTGQLAATFFRAMTGVAAPTTTSGTAASSTVVGIQAVHAGDTGGVSGSTVTAPTTATSLGFSMQINGNLIRIWRTDSADFTIDATDGGGDTQVKALKGKIQSFSDLPKSGFDSMVFQVSGANKAADDDYFVQYQSKVSGDGVWSEIAGPGSHTTLDPTTMPHALVNTGYRTFTWGAVNWSTRVAGDEVSAKNPYFVGKKLQDIFFYSNRLGLLTEGAVDFSKASNEFTFFPDTAQTELASVRIPLRLTASGNSRNQGAALLRKAVQAAEGLFMWAQRAQFRLSSGQDAFKSSAVQSNESTSYEFAETVDPLSMGQLLYFVSETDVWSALRSIAFANGRPAGDTDLTAHVPRYVPAPVRDLAGYDTGRLIFVRSDATANQLYCYQFLEDGNQIIQSAWNTWRLPAGTILWSSIFRSGLFVAIQRSDGVVFLRAELNVGATDPGGDYMTRLDLRVKETQVSPSYSAVTGLSTLTLPYAVDEGSDARVAVVVRTSLTDGYTRGRFFPVNSVSGHTVTVTGDLTAYEFYVGLQYAAERTDSTFYVRSQKGALPTERLTVGSISVDHAKSTYYRIEVSRDDGSESVAEFDGRILGTVTGVTGTPMMSDGRLACDVKSENTLCSIRLINDSPFPSAWTDADYEYQATLRPALNQR